MTRIIPPPNALLVQFDLSGQNFRVSAELSTMVILKNRAKRLLSKFEGQDGPETVAFMTSLAIVLGRNLCVNTCIIPSIP